MGSFESSAKLKLIEGRSFVTKLCSCGSLGADLSADLSQKVAISAFSALDKILSSSYICLVISESVYGGGLLQLPLSIRGLVMKTALPFVTLVSESYLVSSEPILGVLTESSRSNEKELLKSAFSKSILLNTL